MADSFMTRQELKTLGLKSCGEGVKLSRKVSIYGAENIEIGNNVRIDDFCILSGKIVLGDYIHIAAYTALWGVDGIFINDYANVSSRVCIYSVSDDYTGASMTNPMIPENYKKVVSKPVYIERHCIIGSTSVIMPGVTLKEGSSFGAFSFINHDSEAWSMNAGIPFRKLKDRSKQLLIKEKEFRRTL